MQILYGNDGNNYRTLARTKDVSNSIEKAVRESYLSYYFVEDDGIYSAIENHPVSITYVTTNLENVLEKDRVLLCQNARMSNYSTPSSYAHFMILDPEKEGYGENFFHYLHYEFIRDIDAASYDDSRLESYEPTLNARVDREGISVDVLKAVVSLIFMKDKSSEQIRLMVDRTGDGYNKRSLEFIEAIYRYLPYDLRRRTGFCTYAAPNQRVASRVKIILMERTNITNNGEQFWDLADPSTAKAFLKVKKELQEYVNYLFSLEQEEREKYFEYICQKMKGQFLTAVEYIRLFQIMNEWQTNPVEEIFGTWVDYAVQNAGKQSPHIDIFKEIAASRLTNEIFAGYVLKGLERQGEKRISEWDDSMEKLLIFADVIPQLMLPEETFINWQRDHVLTPLKEQYKEKKLVKELENEKEILKGYAAKCIKFQNVKSRLESNIADEIEKETEQIKRKIDQEKEDISNELTAEKIGDINRLNERTTEILNGLKYREETISEVGYRWEVAYREFLNKIGQFRTDNDYENYLAQLNESVVELGSEIKADLRDQLEKKLEWLRRFQRLKSFQVAENFGITAKNQLDELKLEAEKAGKKLFCVEVMQSDGKTGEEMLTDDLGRLLAFIDQPDQNKYDACKMVLEQNNGLVYDLIKTRNFCIEHVKFLKDVSEGKRYTANFLAYIMNYMDVSSTDLQKLCEMILGYPDKKTKQYMIGLWGQFEDKSEAFLEFIQNFENWCRNPKDTDGVKGRGKRIGERLTFFNRKFWCGFAYAILICAIIAMGTRTFLEDYMTELAANRIYAVNGALLIDLLIFAFCNSKSGK